MDRFSKTALFLIALAVFSSGMRVFADEPKPPALDLDAFNSLDERDRDIIEPIINQAKDDRYKPEARKAATHLAALLVMAAKDKAKAVPGSAITALSPADHHLLQYALDGAVDPGAEDATRSTGVRLGEKLVSAGNAQAELLPADPKTGAPRGEFKPTIRMLLRWAIQSALDENLDVAKRDEAERFAARMMKAKDQLEMAQRPKDPNRKYYPKGISINVFHKIGGKLARKEATATVVGRQPLPDGKNCKYQLEIPVDKLNPPRGPGKGYFNPSAIGTFEFGLITDFEIYLPKQFKDDGRLDAVGVVSFTSACLPTDEVNVIPVSDRKAKFEAGTLCAIPIAHRTAEGYANARYTGQLHGNPVVSGEKWLRHQFKDDKTIKDWVDEPGISAEEMKRRLKVVGDKISNGRSSDGSPVITDDEKREAVAFVLYCDLGGDTVCTNWQCTKFVGNVVRGLGEGSKFATDNDTFKGPELAADEKANLTAIMSDLKFTTMMGFDPKREIK